MPGDLDGSERGTDIGGSVYIVNADHRHVMRNLQLMVAQRFQHAYRAQVVRAEIRLGHHALVKAHVHIFVRHLDTERRVDNIVSRYRQAKLLHAGEIAVVAVFIDERGGAAVRGSADKADTLISAGGQMPYGGFCTAQTVAENLVKGLVDRVQPGVDDMLDVALHQIENIRVHAAEEDYPVNFTGPEIVLQRFLRSCAERIGEADGKAAQCGFALDAHQYIIKEIVVI